MNLRARDAAVIGAGIIGTSVAWRLAQTGCQVALLDAGSVGGEASWAGAGMLAPGGEIDRGSSWNDFALESLRLYPQFVEELQSESGCAIDYQRLGAVELAFTPGEWDRLQARAVAQREIGIASERLDSATLRTLAPLVEHIPGLAARYYPEDALVDPRQVMHALRIVCERRHVAIHEHCRVSAVRAFTRSGPLAGESACPTSPDQHLASQGGAGAFACQRLAVRADGQAVEIDTEAGTLTAACAVIAAGAWSGEIAVWRDGERLPIPASFPVKGHLLGYRLDPGSIGPILRHAETYLVQRANGFTVAGSSMERVGFDRRIDDCITAGIHERACTIVPHLRQAPPPEPWCGFRPAADGLEPHIRRLRGTNLWLGYGHYRNGILLAPATARRLSREIIASAGTD